MGFTASHKQIYGKATEKKKKKLKMDHLAIFPFWLLH